MKTFDQVLRAQLADPELAIAYIRELVTPQADLPAITMPELLRAIKLVLEIHGTDTYIDKWVAENSELMDKLAETD